MPRSERCFNILLGVSILSWAVLGLTATDEPQLTPVRLMISALHLFAGSLLLLRGPVERHGSVASCLAILSSLVVSGWAIGRAPTFHQWHLPAQLTFICGGVVALLGFVYLGRSFSILPAVRSTVVRGPFQIVRHPAYLGELIMILACSIAELSLWSVAPLVATLPLVVLRILAEERVLITEPETTHDTLKRSGGG